LADIWSGRAYHVIFEPLDFIGRLAALVPKPRVDLTRYHGAFAFIVIFIRHSLLRFGSYEFIPVIEWPFIVLICPSLVAREGQELAGYLRC
jgi:hypothetical protein